MWESIVILGIVTAVGIWAYGNGKTAGQDERQKK